MSPEEIESERHQNARRTIEAERIRERIEYLIIYLTKLAPSRGKG